MADLLPLVDGQGHVHAKRNAALGRLQLRALGLTQYHWRIVSVLKAYQGKHVLASKKLTSKAC